MALERTYVVPLRRGWLKAPRYKRAKKAVNTLRAFLIRHMKSEDIRLLPALNIAIWTHGIKNPPSRVKINVQKDDKGVVKAQLFGVPFEKKVEPKAKAVKKEQKSETPKVQDSPAGEKKTEPAKVEQSPKKTASPKKAVKSEETLSAQAQP